MSLIKDGTLLPFKRRFQPRAKIPAHVSDVTLWEVVADKGGGLWEFIVIPGNVEKPQSLNHVQPMCQYTANDSRKNMRAAIFYKNSPHKANVEDIAHRRCILSRINIKEHLEVAMVKNSNPCHHRHM